jgi:hypothetical protein
MLLGWPSVLPLHGEPTNVVYLEADEEIASRVRDGEREHFRIVRSSGTGRDLWTWGLRNVVARAPAP